MKKVTIKDGSGKLVEVAVSDEVFEELQGARRTDQTKRRIDRSWLAKEELSDYHHNILMQPQRLMSDCVEENLLVEQMLRCLSKLSEYEQRLIHKRFFEGLTCERIAKDETKSYHTIYRRIDRIISKLSAMMGHRRN